MGRIAEKAADEAIQELRDCAGTHFDPDVVTSFIEILNDIQVDGNHRDGL